MIRICSPVNIDAATKAPSASDTVNRIEPNDAVRGFVTAHIYDKCASRLLLESLQHVTS